MKRTYTQEPVIPRGYTGKLSGFNTWQKHLSKQLDKIKGPSVAQKLSA